MTNDQLTRRLFLQGSGSAATTVALRAAMPGLLALAQSACTARDAGATFEILTPEEAETLGAIAERILPESDTPGAIEAGVVHFMDKAFASFMSDDLGKAREGLSGLQERLGDAHFAALTEDEQDQQLTEIEDTAFFNLMHTMTIYGYFGLQSYGGNIDNAGWKLVGVDGPLHAWQPPFGYYDAEYMRENGSGE